MTIEELNEKIQELYQEDQRHEKLRTAKAESYKRSMALKSEIANHFVENQMKQATISGLDVKAGFAEKFNILGGKIEDPENRRNVINDLVELGYLDDDKVKRYEATEVNESSLQAALRKGPYETREAWKEEGKISVMAEPTVTIKEAKEKAA